MHSTGYVIRFILVITAVAALLLALMFTSLKPMHDKNEAVYNKRAILSAVQVPLGKEISTLSDAEVQEIFDNQMTQYVLNMDGEELTETQVMDHGYKGGLAENVDMAKERKRPEEDRFLPLFVFEQDGEKYFIVSIRGNGLWDEIWGNVAIESDFETVAGVAFDHKGETPGLGAEIKDNPAFPRQFIGKKLFDNDGNYTSVVVRKGGARNDRYEVDGISGATITANGVTEMMYRGIKYYEPFFETAAQN